MHDETDKQQFTDLLSETDMQKYPLHPAECRGFGYVLIGFTQLYGAFSHQPPVEW